MTQFGHWYALLGPKSQFWVSLWIDVGLLVAVAAAVHCWRLVKKETKE